MAQSKAKAQQSRAKQRPVRAKKSKAKKATHRRAAQHSTAQAQKIKGKGKATAQHNRGKAEPSKAGTRRARWGAPEGAGGGVVARGPGSFFLDDCSRAEQLSLAAMAQAPMPGVQGSAEQATVLSTVSRDAEKLALLGTEGEHPTHGACERAHVRWHIAKESGCFRVWKPDAP